MNFEQLRQYMLNGRRAAARILLAACILGPCLVSVPADAFPRPGDIGVRMSSDLHDSAFRGRGRGRDARPQEHARRVPDFAARSQLGSGKADDRHRHRLPRKRDNAGHEDGADKPRGKDQAGKPRQPKTGHHGPQKPQRAHEHDRKKYKRYACVGGRLHNGACICRGGGIAQRVGATLHRICMPSRTARALPVLPLAATAAASAAAATPSVAKGTERNEPVSAARAAEARPDEVLFWLDNALPENTEARIARRLGLEILSRTRSQLIGRRFVHARIRGGKPVADMVADLRGEREISGPQPNFVYRQQGGNGNSGNGLRQYALDRIGWREASRTATGRGAVVAIIDTGLDRAHPDLVDADIREFDAGGNSAADDKAHATALAGIIAGRNTTLGIAPDARILSLRAFSSTPGGVIGSTATVLKSFETAVAKGARILNLSFAGPRDPSLQKAIEAASKRDIILVAAAGNSGHGAPPAFPAAYPEVIAVTATDSGDSLYEGANTGPYVAVAAPGVDVLVPVPGAAHDLKSGTSYAAAHVTGIVALMLELDPRLSPESARSRLSAGAVDLGLPGKDEEFGAGRVNAALSLGANVTSSR